MSSYSSSFSQPPTLVPLFDMKFFRLQGDLVVWAIFFFLSVISLIEVYSAGSFLALKEGSFWSPLLHHGLFLLLAAVAAFCIHNFPCRLFKLIPIFGFPTIVFMLFYVLVAGANLNNGARWIPLGPFSFQPSELAKGIVVTTVALILSTSQGEKTANKKAIIPILSITFIITVLIVTQNFSTAALIGFVVFLMMVVGRIPRKQLFITTLVVGALGGVFYLGLKALPADPDDPIYEGRALQRFSTWRSRLDGKHMVITPDPHDFVVTDKNRQVVHARIAMARAHGTGVAPGRSVQRDFLSAAYSDFIFTIIGEELGLPGCLFVVVLYLTLLFRVGRIASRCEHNFPAFLAMGLGLLLVVQALLNMLVAVGVGPVTGQTLPLISKGGTSTIITGVYFGMILSVSRSARRKDMSPLHSLAKEPNKITSEAFTQA